MNHYLLRLKTILQYRYTLFIFLIAIVLISLIRVSNYNLNEENINSFEGILISKKIDGDKFSFILKNKVKLKGTYYIKSESELELLKNLNLGVKLKINGSLSNISNSTIPNTFNYKNYLKSNNIKYIFKVDDYEVISNNINILYKIKNSFNNYINTFKSKNYLNTFLVGNKDYLDDEIKSKYQELGVSHIFAISGMHISLLTGIILFLLKKFKDSIKYTIVIIFLLVFIFITDFQPSILRSAIFFIMLYFNKKFDFDLDTLKVLFITISLILLFSPHLIINISFLYSSIISASLISLSFLIKGNYFSKCLTISLIAFLVSLPITINTNYEINILSIFNNLFFVPFISFIIFPLSLIVLIIRPLDNVLLFLTNFLEGVSTYLLIFKIVIPKMNIITIIIYYLLIFLFFKTYRKLYLLLIIILLFIIKIIPYIDNTYYVYYLDVSQGDSIFYKHKGNTFLIDTGGKVNYKSEEWKKKKVYYYTDSTITFLKSIGISKLDYLIISHGDNDHMGEAITLVNNFKVEKVIFNNDSFNELETELIKVLDKKKIKYYKGLKELNIKGDKLYFLNTKEYDNENDNSNVLYLKLKTLKFLFMGDASINREKDILDKYNLNDIDFIKIGHHGSNTSSSKYFIDNIKPKNCIISVGKNNRYGHPKESVLDILDDYCNIYRTDFSGSIEIKINKNNYKIKTYSP